MRQLCRQVSGQEHTSRLTPGQADRLIDALRGEVAGYGRPGTEALEPRRPWGRRGPGPRKDQPITPRQQAVLASLFDQAGMGPKARQTFTQRQCRVPWPQTQHHADALFEALTEMILRHVNVAEVYRRTRALIDCPGLDAWEENFVEDLVRQFRELEAVGRDLRLALTTHKLKKLTEAEVHVTEGRQR